MKNSRLFFLPCVVLLMTGCAGAALKFSGKNMPYPEPNGSNISYIKLETVNKTDGFGLPAAPKRAIFYERCADNSKSGKKYGYVGDVEVAVNSSYGNPAIAKVESGKPIFLAFGLINPYNSFECTSKFVFTPQVGATYSFLYSTTWSSCSTVAVKESEGGKIEKIGGLESIDENSPILKDEGSIALDRSEC